ncbi:DUF2569 domain-containing protein [Paenibacillus sp. 481]|uniref:DUF2569 domain-containing protein n=1 Tax=Paenibacillus sp. 481 TaxID=2835869 RepID=UPI001E32E0E4|nr:DUF2569 domain-containing protein [Paenibacillus sp. 481]UHA72790.1 DUF2569 domain-containing protein [Paenibacillus sp. 481]
MSNDQTSVHEASAENTAPKPDFTKYQGLGGWLIIVQIGLILTLISQVVSLLLVQIPFLSSKEWDFITNSSSEYYDPMLIVLVVVEIIGSIALLIFAIVTLTYFYKRKKSLPQLYIMMFGFNLIYAIVCAILFYQISIPMEEDTSIVKTVFRAALTCLIWTPYFLRSKRVKATFIN